MGGRITLLDVGCGTAIFPSYLDQELTPEVHIRADLLDISAASLRRASEIVASLEHFSLGESIQAAIEDLPVLGRYDVIWAIHSFTTVDADRMPDTYARLMAALEPGGYLYVYQLTATSAYQRLHALYRRHRGGRRYMEFEDSLAILSEAGIDLEVHELAFDHVVPDEPVALAGYLQKVSLDDAVPIELFEPALAEYRGDGFVRFPQTVNLIAARRSDEP